MLIMSVFLYFLVSLQVYKFLCQFFVLSVRYKLHFWNFYKLSLTTLLIYSRINCHKKQLVLFLRIVLIFFYFRA